MIAVIVQREDGTFDVVNSRGERFNRSRETFRSRRAARRYMTLNWPGVEVTR
jgi:hypothetical protein